MAMIPASTLTSTISEQISNNWARDSAQAQRRLREQIPSEVEGDSKQENIALTGARIMNYDRPGYVTMQVPIEQMRAAFPGQPLPMREQGQGPFLTTEKPLSPIDTEFSQRGANLSAGAQQRRRSEATFPGNYSSIGQAGGYLWGERQYSGREVQEMGPPSIHPAGDQIIPGRYAYHHGYGDPSRDLRRPSGQVFPFASSSSSSSLPQGPWEPSQTVRWVSSSYPSETGGLMTNPLGEPLDISMEAHGEEGRFGYNVDPTRAGEHHNFQSYPQSTGPMSVSYPARPGDEVSWKSQPRVASRQDSRPIQHVCIEVNGPRSLFE